jgi:hypothetical protein
MKFVCSRSSVRLLRTSRSKRNIAIREMIAGNQHVREEMLCDVYGARFF